MLQLPVMKCPKNKQDPIEKNKSPKKIQSNKNGYRRPCFPETGAVSKGVFIGCPNHDSGTGL